MGLFQKIEGEAAILIVKGVYKQCDLYEWDGALFAKAAGGFVRLFENGSTTKPDHSLKHMTWTGDLYRDGMGRLATKQPPTGRLISGEVKTLLLGAPDGSQ